MNLLLIEDNPADIRLVKEIFKDFKTKIQLYTFTNSTEALKFLKNNDYPSTPDLILLDLSLPCKDGLELLNELKTDDELKQIPIIVLTASNTKENVFNSYKFQANCFITKPSTYDGYEKILQSIKDFWFTVVTLPTW